MNIKEINTASLQMYLEKIGVYIKDLQDLMQLNYNAKKVSKHFPFEKNEKVTVEKIQECQDKYNEIQLELEKRIKVDLGLDLEYDKFTNLTIAAKNSITSAAIIDSKKPMKVVKPEKNDDSKQ